MTRADYYLFMIAALLLIVGLCAFAYGAMRELHEEVVRLRCDVHLQYIRHYELQQAIDVMKHLKVELHVIDKSTILEVIAVTDYFAKEK